MANAACRPQTHLRCCCRKGSPLPTLLGLHSIHVLWHRVSLPTHPPLPLRRRPDRADHEVIPAGAARGVGGGGGAQQGAAGRSRLAIPVWRLVPCGGAGWSGTSCTEGVASRRPARNGGGARALHARAPHGAARCSPTLPLALPSLTLHRAAAPSLLPQQRAHPPPQRAPLSLHGCVLCSI